MKKISQIINLIVVLSVLMCSTVFASSTQNSGTISDLPYEYPITPNDVTWTESIDHSVHINMCQIPPNKLKTMSTQALVETVLNYPMFMDVYAFDSVSIGIESMIRNFNGMKELTQRENAATCLLERYKSVDPISTITLKSYGKENIFEVSNLEVLLAQNIFINQMTQTEKNELTAETQSKYTAKNNNPTIYKFTLSTFYKTLAENTSEAINTNFTQRASTAYVTTPNGNRVSVLIRGEEYSTSEKNSMNSYIETAYPRTTRLGSATTNYNCHSYAWYNQSTSNIYWMNNPTSYMTDGSYRNVTYPSVGNRIYYPGTHSGIIYSRIDGVIYPPYGYTDLVMVTSKWGGYGLYIHNGTNCPYWELGITTKYYTR